MKKYIFAVLMLLLSAKAFAGSPVAEAENFAQKMVSVGTFVVSEVMYSSDPGCIFFLKETNSKQLWLVGFRRMSEAQCSGFLQNDKVRVFPRKKSELSQETKLDRTGDWLTIKRLPASLPNN